jgi:hypothetical protein
VGGVGENFFHFSFVPIKFPQGSHFVPQGFFMSAKFCPCLGEKWWQTVLEREISCCQWEGSAYTHEQFNFDFLLVGGGAGQGLFFVSLVLKVFPDAFPTLFPISHGQCKVQEGHKLHKGQKGHMGNMKTKKPWDTWRPRT